MPRKTKESKELEIQENSPKEEKKNTKKAPNSASKKDSAKKTTKKATKIESDIKKDETKKTATKKNSTAKKASTKSASKASTTKKESSTKTKSVAPKRKTTSTRKTTTSKNSKISVVEYYDLPYRYNQTVVKVLAQTPTNLFIYWDISDDDRKKFQEQYGENFFETTKPVLVVHNDTLGYSFEVEINDFANSWYLHVNDAKCNYRIELGRRPIIKNEKINVDYIYVSMSNEIESPNDHILFDKNQKMVYFRNVKTGIQTKKEITSISFIRNMGKIYNIYDLYKSIYQNDNIEELYDLSNPSSSNPSSRKF